MFLLLIKTVVRIKITMLNYRCTWSITLKIKFTLVKKVLIRKQILQDIQNNAKNTFYLSLLNFSSALLLMKINHNI